MKGSRWANWAGIAGLFGMVVILSATLTTLLIDAEKEHCFKFSIRWLVVGTFE